MTYITRTEERRRVRAAWDRWTARAIAVLGLGGLSLLGLWLWRWIDAMHPAIGGL